MIRRSRTWKLQSLVIRKNRKAAQLRCQAYEAELRLLLTEQAEQQRFAEALAAVVDRRPLAKVGRACTLVNHYRFAELADSNFELVSAEVVRIDDALSKKRAQLYRQQQVCLQLDQWQCRLEKRKSIGSKRRIAAVERIALDDWRQSR